MRIDQYLVENKQVPTRNKAQDMIKAGFVYVNGIMITKNSYAIHEQDHIHVDMSELSFVSRAGFKLYDVLEDFQIQLTHRICIDVGASTGGFSDVCLQMGADLVYAVDVGVGQLDERLRTHPRVINMEQVNCRFLTKDMFEKAPTFACMDVSFISITYILPILKEIMSDIEIVVLIKPQFEAGKENIGKHGVVKDKKVHIQVLRNMVAFVHSIGLYVHHLKASSVLGRAGNKEFVMHITSQKSMKAFDYKKIVENVHITR